MQKPKNYDNVQAFQNYAPLPAGGYVCKIIGMEETKSKAGRDMLKIALDIADGPEKDRFKKEFDANTREDRKWGCVVYQLVLDGNTGDTSRGFKSLMECVEESNKGFDVQWGEGFSKCFKGKLVGALFGREQYMNKKDEAKWSTKCRSFMTVNEIKEGKFKIPADKPLHPGVPDGFVPVDEDDEVPF